MAKLSRPRRLPPRPASRPADERPRWQRIARRPAVWLAGVLVTVLTGTLVNVLTEQAKTTLKPSRSGSPILIRSVTVERHDDQGDTWVFPRQVDLSPGELSALARTRLSDPAGYERELRAKGGVDPGLSHLKVVVEGNRDRPVRIVRMHAVKRCR